ncbi:MAG TPA: lysozyme inhibitor LprI family protein [Steroidobacteraceae bacterium]|jgi:hypothetical protein
MTTKVLAQSFDCKNASRPIEHAICSDKAVADMDVELSSKYKEAMVRYGTNRLELASAERRWIARRDAQCLPSINDFGKLDDCLRAAYGARLRAVASGESSGRIPSRYVAQSVVFSLPKLRGRSADVIANLELTRPFETPMQWTFVAAILPGSHFDGADAQPVDGGALAQCFVENLTAHCTYATQDSDSAGFLGPIKLYAAKVVFAGADNTRPLLLIKTGSTPGGDGRHLIYTELFAYDILTNKFESVFSNATSSNNNQETRFIEKGPLRGDVIVADPTASAPFGYWIYVYAGNRKYGYSRSVLQYRSATHYGDGNHLAVIDSEMPAVLRHMGLWRPGDPLPTTPGCSRPVLRHGEVWCE